MVPCYTKPMENISPVYTLIVYFFIALPYLLVGLGLATLAKIFQLYSTDRAPAARKLLKKFVVTSLVLGLFLIATQSSLGIL